MYIYRLMVMMMILKKMKIERREIDGWMDRWQAGRYIDREAGRQAGR